MTSPHIEISNNSSSDTDMSNVTDEMVFKCLAVYRSGEHEQEMKKLLKLSDAPPHLRSDKYLFCLRRDTTANISVYDEPKYDAHVVYIFMNSDGGNGQHNIIRPGCIQMYDTGTRFVHHSHVDAELVNTKVNANKDIRIYDHEYDADGYLRVTLINTGKKQVTLDESLPIAAYYVSSGCKNRVTVVYDPLMNKEETDGVAKVLIDALKSKCYTTCEVCANTEYAHRCAEV